MSAWPALLAAISLAAVIVALAPARGGGATGAGSVAAGAQRRAVEQIVEARCTPCHAHSPTQPGFNAAPNGLVFEHLDQVMAHLPEVRSQLVTRSMPLGNLTGITEAERTALLEWTAQAGAR